MAELLQQVHVDLGERSYGIQIGRGILDTLGQEFPGRSVLLVSDSRVDPLYGDRAEAALQAAGCKCVRVQVPEGEGSKCTAQLQRLWEAAVEARLDRKSLFVALGGGVVGDLCGFAAASYLRGVDFVQVPSSLLAMVDSSVGGKTGINLPQGKNLVGAFHQPKQVLIDLELLNTLSPREFSAGMAEVIKYGVIWDADLFRFLAEQVDAIRSLGADALATLVTRSCEIKAEVVRQDEREGGLRAILNFGHTLGHAVEKVCGYGTYLHGEAISIGMAYAARVSEQAKGFSGEERDRLDQLLQAYDLPLSWEGLDWEALWQAMCVDKKAAQEAPRFVLAEALGRVGLPEPCDRELLQDCFRAGI